MKDIVKYLKENNNNVDGFLIINVKNDSIIEKFKDTELLNAVHKLNELHKKSEHTEYWIVASINDGYYDLEDKGNYRVLSSIEYNENDTYYGINPKFNKYLI